MSRENVELVRALQPSGVDMVEVVRDDGAPSTIPGELFTDDFTAQFVAIGRMQQPRQDGVEGLVEAWRDWLVPYASYVLDAEDFVDAGDDVVVFGRVRAQTARDHVRVEHSPAAIWSLRGGRISAIRFYLDRNEALEAAGLRR